MDVTSHDVVGLGQVLRTARDEKGWSQGHLSYVSGVSRAIISRLEQGEETCSFSTLEELCVQLGLKAAEEIRKKGWASEEKFKARKYVQTRQRTGDISEAGSHTVLTLLGMIMSVLNRNRARLSLYGANVLVTTIVASCAIILTYSTVENRFGESVDRHLDRLVKTVTANVQLGNNADPFSEFTGGMLTADPFVTPLGERRTVTDLDYGRPRPGFPGDGVLSNGYGPPRPGPVGEEYVTP